MKHLFVILFSVFLAIACLCPFLRGQGSVIIAQVIAGGNQDFVFQTVFKLLDQSGEENSYTLELFRQNGDPMSAFDSRAPFQRPRLNGTINAYGTIEHRTSLGPFGGVLVGWARITTSQAAGVVAVLLNFRRSDLQVVSGTSLIATPTTDALAAFADDMGIGSLEQIGIALVNPSASESATIDFHLLHTDGSPALQRTLQVQPRGQIAQFLGQSPLFSDLETVSPGSIEVRSSIPIAVSFIRVDDLAWSPLPVFPARNVDLGDAASTVTPKKPE